MITKDDWLYILNAIDYYDHMGFGTDYEGKRELRETVINEIELQEEVEDWDSTVGDGLDDSQW